MAYNNAIPNANDKLRNSQPQIKDNFSSIDSSWQVDHVPFNSAPDAGKHNRIQFPKLTNATTPVANTFVAAAGQLALYNTQNATTAQEEIYLKRNSDGAALGIPITAGSIGVSGWSYLPSGLLIKWGNISANGNGNVINMGAGPNFSTATSFRVYLTSNSNNPNNLWAYTAYTGAGVNSFTLGARQITTAGSIISNPSFSTNTYNFLAIGL